MDDTQTIDKTTAVDPFKLYLRNFDGLEAYCAGLTHYAGNFSRDTFIAGILSSSEEVLHSQLKMSATHQGKTYNGISGEMPGRIHHEYPGIVQPSGLSTTYDGCDTTPLFLLGAEAAVTIDPDKAYPIIATLMPQIKAARDYILSMINDSNLYIENPPPGVKHFALNVTYWKDSVLPHASGKKEPVYPVIYSLAHFMAARSLLSAAKLLSDSSLETTANRMFVEGINNFIRPAGFVIYRDKMEELIQASSDELHALAYIPEKYANLLPLREIVMRSNQLKTAYGYVCTPLAISELLKDKYHGNKVWIFEQAMIHYGASKFNLSDQAACAHLVNDHIATGQELLDIVDSKGQLKALAAGNDRQLWSIAAKEYFDGHSILTTNHWL